MRIFKLDVKDVDFAKISSKFNKSVDSVELFDIIDNKEFVQTLVVENGNIIGIYKTNNEKPVLSYNESLNLLKKFKDFNYQVNDVKTFKQFLKDNRNRILSVFEDSKNLKYLEEELNKKSLDSVVKLFKDNKIRVFNVNIKGLLRYIVNSKFLDRNKRNTPFRDLFENLV